MSTETTDDILQSYIFQYEVLTEEIANLKSSCEVLRQEREKFALAIELLQMEVISSNT